MKESDIFQGRSKYKYLLHVQNHMCKKDGKDQHAVEGINRRLQERMKRWQKIGGDWQRAGEDGRRPGPSAHSSIEEVDGGSFI